MNRKLSVCCRYIALIMMFASCSKFDNTLLSPSEKEWLRAHPNLKVAVSPKYPPYQYMNADHHIDGIIIDFFDLIEQKIDYKFTKVYYQNWQPIMQDAKTNQVDVVIEIQRTKERDQFLNFTPPLFKHPHVIIAKDNESTKKSLSDFYDQNVAVVNQYAIHEYLKTKHKDLQLYPQPNDLHCFKSLLDGEVTAYVGQKSIAMYLINTHENTGYRIVGEVPYTNELGFASRKGLPVLNAILTKAVRDITNQERQEILERRIYTTILPFYKKVEFWISVLVLVLFACIVSLIFNAILRKQVALKSLALKSAKEEAEQDHKIKESFITNISQEMKTPIEGVVRSSKLLRKAKTDPKERQQYIKIIVDCSKHMMDSIYEVLSISKSNGVVQIQPKETDLYETLETSFAICRLKAESQQVQMVIENLIPEEQRWVYIDALKLVKMMNNLVENTIKYVKHEKITLLCYIHSSTLIIKVKDSDIGISEANINHTVIFKSFAKAKQQWMQHYPGLGEELTIAKENIEILGGEITFAYYPDKGGVFKVQIPFTPITPPVTNVVNEDEMMIVSRSYHILIVEDGEVNFLFLKTALLKIEIYDFVIHRAVNGKEAVAFCEVHRNIDLIFMDIKMPEMDGYEATRRIKKIDPSFLIIAQTAYSSKEDIYEAYDAGCDDFISKPIDRKVLKILLKKYLIIANVEQVP